MTPSCVRRNFCDSGGRITKHRDNRLKFAEDTRDLIVSTWRKVLEEMLRMSVAELCPRRDKQPGGLLQT